MYQSRHTPSCIHLMVRCMLAGALPAAPQPLESLGKDPLPNPILAHSAAPLHLCASPGAVAFPAGQLLNLLGA